MKVVVQLLLVWLMVIPLGRYALPLIGITLCGLVLALAWLCIPRLGMCWLAVVFEGLLELAMGRALADVLAANKMASGNLWLLVVLCVGCAP